MDASGVVVSGTSGTSAQTHSARKTHGKRKRKFSADSKHAARGRHHGHRPPHAHKKAKHDVSSTRVANNIMKFRLGGSVSDPLNLAGGDLGGDECSTCAPSPANQTNEELIPPLLLTTHLNKDPLNLEGKVKNFPLAGMGSRKATANAGQRRKPRRRTTSGSKPEDITARQVKAPPKDGKFRYGNYNRYYGYRNGGVNEADPRLALLRKELFEGRDCLDIGCNTGQVTIILAKETSPRLMVGMDIDQNLIKTAWRALHRSYTPSLTPDGQPFPSSLTMSRGPVNFPPATASAAAGSSSHCSGTVESGQSERGRAFPHNIKFVQENYVPKSDVSAETQAAEFDVILALSLSKWIHLNWGDAGIKRFFKKVYHHLHPGGKFILEPQPFNSYSKKKRLTEEIFENYQSIQFPPHHFHAYLLSPEVGFAAHQLLGVPDNKSKGFQRPIHLYIKGGVGGALPPLPHPRSVSSSTGSASEEPERLKSVVVISNNQETKTTPDQK